jgi:hypothetical protein
MTKETDMNRKLKIALVAAFSSFAVAGASRAEGIAMNATPNIEQTLRSFDGDNFNVRHVDNWDEQPEHTTGGFSAPERSPAEVRDIQAGIGANRPLVRKLATASVSVRHIVDAQQAADGGITFYVD